MSNVNATTKSASATYFTYDHFNHKIIGSELNFKKSGIPGSAQYNALMTAMERHPNYSLSAVVPKVKKQTYAGKRRKCPSLPSRVGSWNCSLSSM